MSESATTSPFAEPPAAAATALGEDLVDFIINNNDTNPVFHQLANASIDYQPAEDCSDQQLLLEKQFLWSPSPQDTQQVEDLPLPTQARKNERSKDSPFNPVSCCFKKKIWLWKGFNP